MQRDIPNTREECIEADKAFGAIYNATKSKGYGTYQDAFEAGVKHVLTTVNWLWQHNYLVERYKGAKDFQAVGNMRFVEEWDKREKKKEEEKNAQESEAKKEKKAKRRDKILDYSIKIITVAIAVIGTYFAYLNVVKNKQHKYNQSPKTPTEQIDHSDTAFK